jgi:hypothetical protein
MRKRGRPVWATRTLAPALLVMLAASCATLDEDVHLSPLFSNLSKAGGGREIEALAGAVRIGRPTVGSAANEFLFRPIACHYDYAKDESYTHFLVPLGDIREHPGDTVTRFLPLYRFHTDLDDNGMPRWNLIALPGIFWSGDSTGRVARAFFPFGGVIDDFATYDRITFVLFPLFVKAERGGRTSWHFLFPIFEYVSDEDTGQKSGRFWPFFGISRQGGFDRRFYLWPFFHYQRDRIEHPYPHTRWMVWPFYGEDWVGTYKAWTVLWPFFGYARDTKSHFWSLEAPWPIVFFQRPGDSTEMAHITRLWPFYSYYRNDRDGLESTWVVWPFFNRRVEKYPTGTRRAENVIPFWQHWQSWDLEGKRTGSWDKLWPLYQRFEDHDKSREAWPALNPLWHNEEFDEHYAWIWEIYTREADGTAVRERSWGGIWRRDSDPDETREYIAGLWSRRKFREGGEIVHETSILFGLLRWRSQPSDRFTWLAPAMPGPGWPARRHS